MSEAERRARGNRRSGWVAVRMPGEAIRLVAACPRCDRTIPPDREESFSNDMDPHLRRQKYGAFCAGCETWWIVESYQSPPFSRAPEFFTAPRRATRPEAALAEAVLFRDRGVPVPNE
jgi:hypothetical protein